MIIWMCMRHWCKKRDQKAILKKLNENNDHEKEKNYYFYFRPKTTQLMKRKSKAGDLFVYWQREVLVEWIHSLLAKILK